MGERVGLTRAAWLVTVKDLRLRLRDRSVFLFAIAAPFVLVLVFSFVFPSGVPLDGVCYAVVDDGGGPVATAFAEQLLPQVAEQLGVAVESVPDRGAARAAVEAGAADAAFVVPSGFDAAVTSGQAADIEVIVGDPGETSGQVAIALARQFTDRLTASQRAVGAAIGGGAPPSDAAAIAQAVASSTPVSASSDVADTRVLDPTTYLAAGMAVFFLFFTVQYGVLGLLEERRDGTLARLFAAPIPHASVYAGKALVSVVVGVASMAFLLVAFDLLLDTTWGDPVGVAVLVVAGVLAATGVMAVVAVLARTAEQASNWQSIIAVVLGMLGGSFFQVFQGPGLLSRLSLVTPHAWFLRGLGELAGGGGVASALPAAAAMLLFAVAGFAVAGWLLGRTPDARGRAATPGSSS